MDLLNELTFALIMGVYASFKWFQHDGSSRSTEQESLLTWAP